jgi:acyl-CoA synthetase (AMP-forming)/AMP-acid ligase II
MVWLQTPSLMKGYFERPDLTDASIRQSWFMTGDIGTIDERGRLYLKGRKRDEINKGGMKVYPADIDEVVGRFTATRDVCTFGIEDELYGQDVAMAVVLEDDSDRTIHALHQWMESRIARHKQPMQWYLMDDIPRTSRGKVNRETVAQHCRLTEPLNLQQVIENAIRQQST